MIDGVLTIPPEHSADQCKNLQNHARLLTPTLISRVTYSMQRLRETYSLEKRIGGFPQSGSGAFEDSYFGR